MGTVHVEEWIDRDILSKSQNKAMRLRELLMKGLLYEQQMYTTKKEENKNVVSEFQTLNPYLSNEEVYL